MIDSGCFGHESHRGLHRNFPMVSSTNVDAVAANNVALQHCGQKSGVRARDDEQWKTNLQITCDVRNVKPLSGTSAMKHRRVTIIINHVYDRIIFRNETVNLVSHDCHSYLHII